MEKKKNSTTMQSAIIGAKLLLICFIVAVVLAFVYHLTIAKYEENLQHTKDLAVAEIFGGSSLSCKEVYTDAETGAVVYQVTGADGVVAGYCVESLAPGFGGDIGVMVGYRLDTSILGVSIVSMSETPGLGSKIGDAEYLKNYVGDRGELELGRDVDAISGATISSRALLDAVNRANDALDGYRTEIALGGVAS